jgi:hypothetical protein
VQIPVEEKVLLVMIFHQFKENQWKKMKKQANFR